MLPVAVALDFDLTCTSTALLDSPDLAAVLEENPRLHHGAVLRFAKTQKQAENFDPDIKEAFNILADAAYYYCWRESLLPSCH